MRRRAVRAPPGSDVARLHPEPEHGLVVVDRPLQVADLQMHGADVRVIGQSERGRRDAVWSRESDFTESVWT